MLQRYNPHSRETGNASQAGGLRDPQRGSASTQTWMPQPLDCLKRPVCPGLPHSTVCPKKITLRNRALPPRQGPSRASVALGNEPFGTVWGYIGAVSPLPALPAPASPGHCAWQLQTPRGARPHDGHSCRSASPHPAPASTSQSWGCCAKQGGHPVAPCQAALLRPGCGGRRGGRVHWGGSFVHWELTGSLPPISHGLFLLPPAWALCGSRGDKGPVHAWGPQRLTGTMLTRSP